MIFHPVAPRSEEWKRLRLGLPCSSEFHKIITPKKMELSKQAPALLYKLLSEWITGEPCENAYQSEWMERGTELEESAIKAYETIYDVETEEGGFFTTDDGMLGCSPDRLIGVDADLEIKAPLLHSQIGYALGDPVDNDYNLQLQGRLMIHGRQWIDIFSYHPRLPIPAVRVKRDEEMIEKMRPVLEAFVATLLAKREELNRRYGPFVRTEHAEPEENDTFGVSDEDVDRILAAQRAARESTKEKI